MGDREKNKTSWKERLLDSWHQPWYLRKASSYGTIHKDAETSSKVSQRRKRRALSATRLYDVQPKCAFLSRVPGEVRNIIYLLVLGNRRLGIHDRGPGPLKGRIRHSEIPPQQTGFTDTVSFLTTNKLAILQTCRQIYLEAVDILYTTNHFQMLRMQDMKVFTQFMQSISPTRLASITNLTLVANVEYFEPLHPLASNMFKHWRKMWATISLYVSALRHLTLYLRNLWAVENLKLTADTYWVKPFLQLRNLENFDLVVNREDIVAPEGFQDRLEPNDTEQLTAKVERLRQYSKKLLCCSR
ncbi:MAG: hypothetical protein Q9225_002663 [Loekoesia sp. 1 TL-2023]